MAETDTERERLASIVERTYLRVQYPNGGGYNGTWVRSFSLKIADAILAEQA